MSYQLKYYYEFRGALTNALNRVEIWEDTAIVLTPQEIQAQHSPFIVTIPQIKNVYQPVSGKGCELNLIASSNYQLYEGLFHSNAKQFMIKHILNGSVNFLGYLNQEIYREAFQFTTNYPVSITGNDGLALLSRYRFIDSSFNNYTGIKSIWSLIKIIVDKIGLPFSYIKVDMSSFLYQSDDDTGTKLPISEVSSTLDSTTALNPVFELVYGGDTIFHHTYVSCANFYNESNEPMTMREVLEEILKPFNATLRISKDSIYIQDINSQSQASMNYLSYDASTFEFVTYDSPLYTVDINNVGYAGTGSNIEFRQGINRQAITYSPYVLKDLYKNIFSDLAEYNIPNSWYSEDFVLDKGIYLKQLPDNPMFERTNGKFVQLQNQDYALFKWDKDQTAKLLLKNKVQPDVCFSSMPVALRNDLSGSVKLRISASVLIRTVSNPFVEELPSHIIYAGIRLYFKLKVTGESVKYYDSTTSRWGYTPAYTFVDYTRSDVSEDVSNKWINIVYDVWLHDEERALPGEGRTASLFGGLEVSLVSNVKTMTPTGQWADPSDLKDTFIKDLSISVIDMNKREIVNQDKKYEAILEQDFQESGEDVILKCGTQINYNCNRGAILRQFNGKYYPANYWERWTNKGYLEGLLLSSLVSNNEKGTITLSGLKLKRNFELHNILIDNTYLYGKKMIISQASVDYSQDIIDCSLTEIRPDSYIVMTGSDDAEIVTINEPETPRDDLITTGKPPADRKPLTI